MKKDRAQEKFLTELSKLPVVTAVCETLNISRNSVYRWRKEDPGFAKKMDEALVEGETRLIEVAETNLISLVQDSDWKAIHFVLSRRSPKYRERLELSGSLHTSDDNLTPEQEAEVRKALTLGLAKPKKQA